MDPERPIEKLLRQAAEARRVQGGVSPELHPANRRMLQNEVARKYGSGAPQRRSFLDLYMPRLAWGAAMIVGLGVAALLMLPREKSSPKEMFLAKNDRVSSPSSSVMNETLDDSAARSASSATSTPETPALAKAVQDSHSTTRTDLALAERDKDTSNVERRQTDSERRQLAINQPAPASQPVPATVAPPAEERQKKELAANTYGGESPQTPVRQEEMLQRRYGLAGAPTASTATSGTGGVAPSSATPATDEKMRAGLASSAAPSGPEAVSSSAAKLKSVDSLDVARRSPAPVARVSQRFVEAQGGSKIMAAGKPILASFELQQLGRDVRIVDSDGSVYSGSFEAPASFYYLNAASREGGANRALESARPQPEQKGALYDSKLQTDISYAFRVTGTNQSLNQAVTFTGQVLAPTNALSLAGPAGTVNGNRFAPPELNALPLQNSRIAGKVLIGTNKEVEVNAIPAH